MSSIEENIRVVQAFFRAYNAHNLDAMDKLRASSFESDSSIGAMTMEGVHRYDQSLITAFPNLHFDITMMVAEGNYVAVNWIVTGTHNGVMRTPSKVVIPPTGRLVHLPGSQTFELKSGRITRNWWFTDMLSLLSQLGLTPPLELSL